MVIFIGSYGDNAILSFLPGVLACIRKESRSGADDGLVSSVLPSLAANNEVRIRSGLAKPSIKVSYLRNLEEKYTYSATVSRDRTSGSIEEREFIPNSLSNRIVFRNEKRISS
jgi:hypothetical protein